MVGVAKSLVTTGSSLYPNSSVTNQLIYVTGVHNAHSATATLKDGASNGTVLAKVKSGASFTPASPVTLTQENKIHCDVTDVTITYVIEGGPAFTGPAGLTFTSTSY